MTIHFTWWAFLVLIVIAWAIFQFFIPRERGQYDWGPSFLTVVSMALAVALIIGTLVGHFLK